MVKIRAEFRRGDYLTFLGPVQGAPHRLAFSSSSTAPLPSPSLSDFDADVVALDSEASRAALGIDLPLPSKRRIVEYINTAICSGAASAVVLFVFFAFWRQLVSRQ
jgi:hypothetical protein